MIINNVTFDKETKYIENQTGIKPFQPDLYVVLYSIMELYDTFS